MATTITFDVTNWIITPEALALHETPPATISAQNFILQLTGVVNVDLQGTLNNDWLRETITINPDLTDPINWATSNWSIPRPPSSDPLFMPEHWTLFAAVSSTVYSASSPVNVGFAVDNWRLTPTVGSAPIFQGMDVDIAVLDKGELYRISYNITVVGQIAFTQHIQ